MVITCLLITAIALLSRFYTPEYPEGHIVNYLRQNGGGSQTCQGMIDSSPAFSPEGKMKLLVRLDGCKDGEMLKPLAGRVQLTIAPSNHRTIEPSHHRTITPSNPATNPLAGRHRTPPLTRWRAGIEPSHQYGDIVRFKARLREPVNFKNPGSFNFRRYCMARGISALGYIDDPNWLSTIGRTDGHSLRMVIEDLRRRIGDSLAAIKEDETRGVARALMIGDDSAISEDVRKDFRMAGLAHILVISGLHVGFAGLIAFFIFKSALSLPPGIAARFNVFKPAAFLTIIAVWFYAYITGAELSVIRAAVMATVYLAGIMLDRRQDIFTSLSLAALIIIASSPLAVYDISFQLSFVTVLAIAVLYPEMASRLSWLKAAPGESFPIRMRRYISQTVAISTAAAIGAAPLVAYYFHYSSLAGIIANVIVIPWTGFVIIPASLAWGAVAVVWPPLAELTAPLIGALLWPLIKTAHIAAMASKLFTIALTPPKLSVLMFYHIAAFAALRRYLRFAYPAIALCGLVLIAGFAIQNEWFAPGRLEVSFLDVGQASSAVVRFPTGEVMVVDGGGLKKSPFDIGRAVVAPYLWRKGISRVDWLVATHAHPDHFKGLGFLAEEFRPRALLWNGVAPEDNVAAEFTLPKDEGDAEEWNEFIKRVKNAGVPIGTVAAKFTLPVAAKLALPENVAAKFTLPVAAKFTLPENVAAKLNPAAWRDALPSLGRASSAATVIVDFLNPPPEIPAGWNLNDTSIVTRVSYGGVSFLLTGDIESEAENTVAAKLNPAAWRDALPENVAAKFTLPKLGRASSAATITVLQVPHHGSATSSTQGFLDAVRPQYAVIQAGDGNSYGLPNKGVLERLAGTGARILRTDKRGTVEFKTDGKNVWLKTFRSF